LFCRNAFQASRRRQCPQASDFSHYLGKFGVLEIDPQDPLSVTVRDMKNQPNINEDPKYALINQLVGEINALNGRLPSKRSRSGWCSKSTTKVHQIPQKEMESIDDRQQQQFDREMEEQTTQIRSLKLSQDGRAKFISDDQLASYGLVVAGKRKVKATRKTSVKRDRIPNEISIRRGFRNRGINNGVVVIAFRAFHPFSSVGCYHLFVVVPSV
jgi:hypothetical protein